MNKENEEATKFIDQKIEELKIEKAQIRHEEEIKNHKALDLSKQLKKLKEVCENASKAIIETQLELNKYCTHERIRTENRNYEGGYLNRAEYWTDYFCEICGAKVDEEVEYGGFA